MKSLESDKNSSYIVYALFIALIATFSFPYGAKADASVNGFFRENLVSSSVFDKHQDFALSVELANAKKRRKSIIQKRVQKRNFNIRNNTQLISNNTYKVSKASHQSSDSFAID